MSSDMNIVFQEEQDWRRRQDTLDAQEEVEKIKAIENIDSVLQEMKDKKRAAEVEELIVDQELADRHVLHRVKRGETHYGDFLYLVGRLNLNLNDLEK